MNGVYVGDHPASPHECAFECPACGYEFDEPDGLHCPECDEIIFSDPEDLV